MLSTEEPSGMMRILEAFKLKVEGFYDTFWSVSMCRTKQIVEPVHKILKTQGNVSCLYGGTVYNINIIKWNEMKLNEMKWT